MWFWNRERKRQKKQLEHALFSVKYARRMKEDLLDARVVAQLRDFQERIHGHLKARRYAEGQECVEPALDLASRVHPAPGAAYALRENLEVLLVVLAVALGIRTYFAQPYQIPTGSMQPTLYGVTARPHHQPDWTDRPPARWIKFALTGGRYVEVRAKADGILPAPTAWKKADTFLVASIGGRPHKIHEDFELLARPGERVARGQLIARGYLKQGDHIIVNRLTTNFIPPRRGDITVFTTRGLPPMVRENSAYIKRLVGEPGDTVGIRDGKLLIDGEELREPFPFRRMYEGRGYSGYLHPSPMEYAYYARLGGKPYFPDEEARLALGANDYLLMGDNSPRSLDGRFFGPVPGENIIGIGFFVPWPFFHRGIYDDIAGPVR